MHIYFNHLISQFGFLEFAWRKKLFREFFRSSFVHSYFIFGNKCKYNKGLI